MYKIGGIVFLLLFFYNCKTPKITNYNQQNISKQSKFINMDSLENTTSFIMMDVFNNKNTCLYYLHYDAETKEIKNVKNETDLNKLSNVEKVDLLPYTARTDLKLCILKEGKTSWIIEIKKPADEYKPITYTIPDNTPVLAKTYIINDTAYYFDAKNILINKTPFNTSAYSLNILNIVNLNNDILNKIDTNIIIDTIIKINDEIENIVSKIKLTNQTQIVTFDKKNNKILGNCIKDVEGKTIFKSLFLYENKESSFVKQIIQRSLNKTNSGIDLTTEKTVIYHTLETKGGLTKSIFITKH